MYGIHFFKTHGLGCQLHLVHLVPLWLSVLVFHRYRQPMSGVFRMPDCIRNIIRWEKFYHVADAVETEFTGCDIDRAKGDMVTTLLTIERVVNMLVQQLSFNRQPIVVPLLLKMYESPLSGAEPVVLYPRQHKHIVFAIH